jgi:hypothetical protein
MTRKATGLRRSVLRSKKTKGKGGGGWKGSYRDRFDIPKAAGTHILLTRGDYDNPEDLDSEGNPTVAHFHSCQTHPASLAKSGPGSYFSTRCALEHAVASGGTQDDADCLPCLRMKEGDKRFGYKSRALFSFNMLHLALYERVHEIKNGKKSFYDRDYGENIKRGDPVMIWTEVTKPKAKRRIEDDIDDLLEQGDVRMLAKKYMELGSGFRDQLATIEDESSTMCMCGGDLTPIVFLCEQCEEVLADVEGDDEDDGMDEAEIAAYSAERQRCQACGHQGFPVAEPVCSDCDDPQALTPFDVVVKIRKRGEGTGTTLIFDEVIPLTEFELPDGSSLLQWDGDEPVLDSEGNWKFNEEFSIEKLATSQFNFEKVHTPMTNGWIASRLGVTNPFPDSPKGGASSKYQNYGKKKEDTEDDSSEEETKRRPARRPARRRR